MSAGDPNSAPDPAEIEVAMLGPGYGESILIHTGGGEWIVIDSFLERDGRPSALAYLERSGCDPARAIRLVVATHWHDDHIRGMGRLVEVGRSARFCCAGALRHGELLAMIEGWRGKGSEAVGVGAREISSVFTHLGQSGTSPVWATAGRRIHSTSNCEVWSLSPSDGAYTTFLESLDPQPPSGPSPGIRSLTPNQLSVALLVRFRSGISCLFGADLERRGWTAVLRDEARLLSKSSVFKIPHHGSANADLGGVWEELLDADPIAILAPWRLGGWTLPKGADVKRILARTAMAYATTDGTSRRADRNHWVRKRMKKVGPRVWPRLGPPGMIRLRRKLVGEDSWRVDLFGSACHLREFAA